MTNREWLEDMTDIDLAKWITDNYLIQITKYLKTTTGAQSICGQYKTPHKVQDWLREEHKSSRVD